MSRRWVIALVATALLGIGWMQRVTIREWLAPDEDAVLPVAEEAPAVNVNTEVTNTNSTNTSTTGTNNTNVSAPTVARLPDQKNLNVPFTTQAPLVNWDQAHEEACEEASSLIVASYWQHRSLTNKAAVDAELLKIEDWEVERFGYYADTTAAETAIILKEYFKLPNTTVKPVTSWDDVKREIVAGRPVILPTAGRDLHNPYFTGAGPIYHMVVVKGYLKDGRIITNDPGTRRGADYIYNSDVLWNAIHDWTGRAADGDKVMIVVQG